VLYGTVVAVEQGLLGSSLVAPLLATDTTLVVDHTADFNEDGGVLLVSGVQLTYTGLDEDAGTITLAAAAGVTADTSDPVQVVEAGAPLVQWYAHVALVDGSDDSAGDTVPAELPTNLVGYFPEGSYDTPVPVELQLVGGTYRVTSQPQVAPTLQGSVVLDPTSVPPARDGVVPAAVATVTTLGGLGLIFVKWSVVTTNANGDPQTGPVRYRVYGAPVGSPLPLDATTLLAETAGTMAAVKYLADGTPFAYDATYAFVVQAYDEDGNAAASPTASGSMDQAASGDLAAGSVTAETLAGIVVLGTTISTRSLDASGNLTGPGIDLTPTGLFSYDAAGGLRVQLPNDPTQPNVFRGDAEIDHLTVGTLTTLQQTLLAQGSTLVMQQGVVAPTNPPSATIGYSATQHTDDGQWSDRNGLAFDGTYWYTSRTVNGRATMEQWNADGTLRRVGHSVASMSTAHSVCVANGYAWMLYWNAVNAYWVLGRFDPNAVDPYFNPIEWYMFGGTAAQMPYGDGSTARTLALGYDTASGEFLLAQSRDDNGGKVRVQRITAAPDQNNGVAWGATFNTTYAWAMNLSSIAYGSFDFGAAHYVFTNYGNTIEVVDTAGVLDTANQWDSANTGNGTRGLWWDGANFWTIGTTGKRSKYEAGNKWTATADATWYAAYTWRNASTPAETTVSPVLTFTMKKRARVTTTTAALPSGVTEARVYFAKGATVPSRTAQSMTLAGSTTGSPPSRTDAAVAFAPLNNPAAAFGFGVTTPASIQSVVTDSLGALVQLAADGSGRTGWSRWDGTGKSLTPSLIMTRNADLSIPNAALTNVTWTDTERNVGGWVGSGGVFTIAEAGLYAITACITWGGNTTGRRVLAINIDGNAIARSEFPAGGGSLSNAVATEVALVAGQTVNVQVFQSSGGALALDGTRSNRLTVRRVG